MNPTLDPGQPAREFVAAAAQASRPNDDWIRALATGAPAPGTAASPPAQSDTGTPAAAAPTTTAPAAAAPPAPATGSAGADIPTVTVRPPRDPSQPIGLAIDDASRSPGVPEFFRRLAAAAAGGAAQSLRDLEKLQPAVTGSQVGSETPAPDYAQPLAWGDLLHPETALTKAVYQVAHGAPVLAGGLAGAFGGAALASESGPGAAVGATVGGALGAGAVSVAQSLGPYYAAALRQPGATPQTAFDAALKQAGQDGAFTAAGWALFGIAPFKSAVQNLLLQAFGVQPAAAVAEQGVRNVESGAPLTTGMADAALQAAVGTALPAAAHAAVRTVLGGGAPAPAAEGAATSAGEPAAPPGTPAGPKIGRLETLDPSAVQADAQRFQFKSGADAQGVTDRLQGVKTWDPRLAGTVMVWRDENGQNWIADGHQRLGLAQRLMAEGQDVSGINAWVMQAQDGVTAEQARTIAAAKNIAEGTGSPIDAAKVIRDAQQQGIDMPPLPPRSALVRDGQALAKLAPDAFGMAVNEVVPPNQAAIVGRLVTDGPQQVEALRVLSVLKPENARQAESVVRDMLATGTDTATQQTLFGAEDFASSIVLERAKIIDEATRQLARDRRTFSVLVNRADEISSAGNQLAGDANAQRLSTDEQASQLLQTLATTRGPVSDELSAIARDFKSGTLSRADAGRRFLRAVRRAIEEGLDTGPAAGGTGPGDAGGTGAGAGAGAAGEGGQPGLALGGEGAPPGAGAAGSPAEPPTPQAAGGASEPPEMLFGPESDLATPQVHAPPPGLSINGDPLDRLNATPELQDAARRFLNGETDANPVQASLESLTRDANIDAEIQRLATFIPRDGVKPDDMLRSAAYQLQMDVTEAAAALRGRLPSDEQIGAFAMMMNAAGREAYEAARAAVQSGLQEDWTKAIRATVLMLRLTGEWTQAGTEQGRAFRARQLAWDARADLTRQVQDVVNFVGQENVETLVRKVAALDGPAKLTPFMRTLRWMRGRDGLLYAWYNLLLSNPTTFVKKGISDGTMAAFNLAARYAAEKNGDAVAPGEAGALLAGYVGSMGDALKAAWKAMQAGHSQFASDYTMLDGLSTNSRLSVLAAGMEPPEADGPTLRGWQYLRAFLPTSLIGGMDDFAKVMNYRAELNAAAWRKAWQEKLTGDAQIARQAELLDVVTPDLHEQAMAAALRNTFQEPLQGFADHISDLADWSVRLHGTGIELPIGRMVIPFVRTPANIIRTAASWTGLPALFDGTQVRADLDAGGARRALRQAQIGLGLGVSLIGSGLAWSGQMTGGGPSQPELRRAWLNAGYQPYSIRVGDNWYGYRKIEPIGVLLGTIADTADLLRYANEQDALHSVTSLVFGVGNAILSASYLEGFAGLLNALNNPETEAPRYLAGQMTSMFIPQGAAAVERAIDPWRRAHQAFLDTLQAKIPGAGDKLPVQRDVFGDPIPQRDAFLPGLTGTGAARLLSPFSFAPADSADPIKKWIWDHRTAFPNFDSGRLGFYSFMPTQSFAGPGGVSAHVQLAPQQLDRLKELAGSAVTDPRTGLGMKAYLSALVTGRNPDRATQSLWNQASDEARAIMVRRVFDTFRSAARQTLLREDPQLADQVRAQWQQQAQRLRPQPAGGAPAAGGASASRMPQLEGSTP